MRTILLLIFASLSLPALAQTGRFEPGNPWFDEFVATCRDGDTMIDECQLGVLKAFRAASGREDVSCDWHAFWAVVDARKDSKVLFVLPWQYGVESVIAEPGVCKAE